MDARIVEPLPSKHSVIVQVSCPSRYFQTVVVNDASTLEVDIHVVIFSIECFNIATLPDSVQCVMCLDDSSSHPKLGQMFLTEGSILASC